jgi:ligand-binding sensor domain-containing protein
MKTDLISGAQTGCIISGNRLCIGGWDTVSISTDGGETWSSSQVLPGSASPTVLSVAEDSTGNLYAGLSVGKINGDLTGGGIYISSDSGRTWGYYGMSHDSVQTIIVDRSGRVFILTPLGILSAGTKDSNWTRDVLNLPNAGVSGMASDSSGEPVVYADNMGFYAYHDSGRYWEQVSEGVSSANVTSFFYNPNETSYAGTNYDGVFSLNGLTSEWCQCGIAPGVTMAVGFDKEGNLFAGTDDGVYKSGVRSGTWIRRTDDMYNGKVQKIDTLSFMDGIVAETSSGSFFSTDQGRSWILKSTTWSYDMAEASDGHLYLAAGNGVWISTDRGDNWTEPADIGFPSGEVFSILYCSSLFAGTSNNGVFVTTDDGNFWIQTGISSPLMFCSVKTIAHDGTTLFAGTDTLGAFFSADFGQSWTHISAITASDVSSFLLNRDDKYFVGTLDGGVFVSPDHGQTWETMNSGLIDKAVYSLAIDSIHYLYAATDSGVFKTVGEVTSIRRHQPIPASIQLDQNYPNPFNPSTTISYELSANSFVTLKVYDVLGREVKALVNERQNAGSHSATFNASNLPSGVYFYRLVAGNYIATKKMVMVK